jgi:hypothetical protein
MVAARRSRSAGQSTVALPVRRPKPPGASPSRAAPVWPVPVAASPHLDVTALWRTELHQPPSTRSYVSPPNFPRASIRESWPLLEDPCIETKAHGAPVFFAVKLLDYGGAAAHQDSGRNHPRIIIAVSISGRCRQSLAMVSTSPRPPIHLSHQRTTTSHFSLAFMLAGSLLHKLLHS